MKIKKILISFIVIFYFFQLINFAFIDCPKNEKNNFLINNLVYLNTNNDIEKELNDNIENQLNDIDFDSLNQLVDNLSENGQSLLGDNNFFSLVKKFISGENIDLYNNFFSYVISIIFDDIVAFVPYFALIIAIAVVYSLLGQFSSDKNKSVSNLMHIVCFSSIAVIILKLILDIMNEVSGIITAIEAQMEVIFPVLLTIINALGSVVTASSFQPLLAILSVSITKLFTIVLIPIFISSIVFGVVGNISKNVKLEKFSKFFSSFFNWIIGIVFTIFIAFLSIQGLTVSTIDSISLKTAKFAIKSYVPILGSYLSDGVSLILASSVLIKNAIGATGLIVLFATIFLPMIKIIILMLLFKLVSAIIESISDEKISNFLFGISKSLNMLNVCLLAIGFMYLISISMLMSCSNII